MSKPIAPISVKLWMEGDQAHLHIHTEGLDFADARDYLVKLRNRLTEEIEADPERCPFRPQIGTIEP